MHANPAAVHAHPVGETGPDEVASSTAVSTAIAAVNDPTAIIVLAEDRGALVHDLFLDRVAPYRGGLAVAAGADRRIDENGDVFFCEELCSLIAEIDINAGLTGGRFFV